MAHFLASFSGKWRFLDPRRPFFDIFGPKIDFSRKKPDFGGIFDEKGPYFRLFPDFGHFSDPKKAFFPYKWKKRHFGAPEPEKMTFLDPFFDRKWTDFDIKWSLFVEKLIDFDQL